VLRCGFASKGPSVILFESKWAPSFVNRYLSIGASCCQLRIILLFLTLNSTWCQGRPVIAVITSGRHRLLLGCVKCRRLSPAHGCLTPSVESVSSRLVGITGRMHIFVNPVSLVRPCTRLASLTRCRLVGVNVAGPSPCLLGQTL
jgi:hypothetical protein